MFLNNNHGKTYRRASLTLFLILESLLLPVRTQIASVRKQPGLVDQQLSRICLFLLKKINFQAGAAVHKVDFYYIKHTLKLFQQML